MADFTITRPVPFVVEGVDGTLYELPRIGDLSAEQVAALKPISDAEDEMERVRETKAFVLSLCPALADEPLPDMGYLGLFTALAEGSGISLGES